MIYHLNQHHQKKIDGNYIYANQSNKNYLFLSLNLVKFHIV